MTRFFSGKMLKFVKTSLESFTYDLTEIFFFLNKNTQEIYETYLIKKIYPYSVLTDTDYICVFVIFIYKPECYLPDSQFRDVLFEVIKTNRNVERFDTSDEFWDRYSIRKKSLNKTLGYFSVENSSDP